MVAAALALTCSSILAAAGAGHLLRLSAFCEAIDAQRVLPSRWVRPVATIMALGEAVLGIGGIALTVHSNPATHTLLFLTLALVYACYAIYGWYLLRSRPGVPCACTGYDDPIDSLVVARAVVLAVMAVIGAAFAPVVQDLTAREIAVVSMATLAYGIVLWALPGALREHAGALTGSGSEVSMR